MHEPNFKPNTIFCCDNLPILQKINAECIDLIYLDPPFNKKKKFSAPIGSSAEGAEFLDYFVMSDIKERWVLELQEDKPKLFGLLHGIKNAGSEYNYAYLTYMAMRLIECHRVLKQNGSIYLHCDPTMSHYLKLFMDVIFGENNFRNEIVWAYRTGGVSKQWFGRKHDVILYYSKTNNATFHMEKERSYSTDNKPPGFKGIEKFKDEFGRWYTMAAMRDVWEINAVGRSSKERTGYPTQKPLALLKRIIRASSNPGDLILDPFCGCATACVAAQALGRKWVGIDVAETAWQLTKERMAKEIPDELQDEKYNFRTDIPIMTHAHANQKKYVYVISSKSHPGKYKVGVATDTKRRLNSYQTSSPARDYEIVYEIETVYYAECEKYIHDKFQADHEWVEAGAEQIKSAINAFIKNPDVGNLFQYKK